MKTAIGVLAEAPVPGRCKTRLLAAHGAEWVAGLYAAMLRDTLDGLQSVTADEYLVFVAPVPPAPGEEQDEAARTKAAFDVLARRVPAPWELVPQQREDVGARLEHALVTMFERGVGYALAQVSDAPSFPVDPLAAAFVNDETQKRVLVCPSEAGGYHAIAMARFERRLVEDMPWHTPALLEMTRVRCKELGVPLEELPKWHAVEEPSDVLVLLEEMRKHPERAPRTAQFLVTNA
jgi:glycosyltransferase A (GT-A) superfamily protein (DUF2064 family)